MAVAGVALAWPARGSCAAGAAITA